MKIINRLCVALFVAFAVTSCSDDFFDVNNSENNPVSSTPELSLPVAQKQTVDLLSGGYNSYNTLGNLWSYAWAAGGDFIFFTDETKYLVTSAFRPGSFNTPYLGALSNYKLVIDNTDPQYANYKAISMIMTAFHYQYLVDLYGDIPYTEALQRQGNTTPAYDDDQAIYADLLLKLTEAQGIIATASTDVTVLIPGVNQDVMCAGDMTKWAKFANTLKLRIMLREIAVVPFDASVVNNGIGFLGAGETVYGNPGYANDTDKQNPLFAAFGLTVAGDPAANQEATRATPFGISMYQMVGDAARLARVYKPVAGSMNFLGIEQNNNGGLASASLSGVGPGILVSSLQNGIVMQSAESLLLQAEAVVRGTGVAGDATALFNAAVQESYTQLGAGDASVILTQGLAFDGTVEMIINEKWRALNGTNGIENYIEFKRTGFPTATPIAPNANSPVLPVRLLYPATEVSTNPNVPVQTAGDAFSSKVFWDN